MKKLLITGASGFLGWHLCVLAQTHWQVYGTYHHHAVHWPGVEMVSVDLTDRQAVWALFEQIRPDAVIHTAAQSRPNLCQQQPEAAYEINVAATCTLAKLCGDRSIPFLFTSTEMVFDGLNPPYRETDPVCPVNLYGEQKVMAEEGVLQQYPEAIVCRMPLMFGQAPYARSFLQTWLETLESGQPLHLFVDEFRNPLSGFDAARGILLVMQKAQGRVHLGGKERLSRYALGQLIAEIWQFSNPNLHPCHQAEVSMPAPRPPDLFMDCSLAFALGFRPMGVREALEAVYQQGKGSG